VIEAVQATLLSCLHKVHEVNICVSSCGLLGCDTMQRCDGIPLFHTEYGDIKVLLIFVILPHHYIASQPENGSSKVL